MSKHIDMNFDWLRLDQGSVRHFCLPHWLHSPGSTAPNGPHRWTACGRTGVPNMEPYLIPRQYGGGRRMFDPVNFHPCKDCISVLAELLVGPQFKLLERRVREVSDKRQRERQVERDKALRRSANKRARKVKSEQIS